MARLYVLGSGALGPSPERQTSAYLLETRRSLVLLDAGTGLSRFLDPLFVDLEARVKRVLVLLSGYEQSRIAGLAALPLLIPNAEITIAGPGPGPVEMLSRAFAEPFFDGGYEGWVRSFRVLPSFHTLRPGVQRVDGERVEAEVNPAARSRMFLRVRDVLYTGGPLPAEGALPGQRENLSLIIADAGRRVQDGESVSHPHAKSAARFALDCKAKDLMITGILPSADRASLDNLLFETSFLFPRTIVATDMMFFRFQSSIEEDLEQMEAASVPLEEVSLDDQGALSQPNLLADEKGEI
ncbi:MAG TPA: hypothetical protein PKA37_05360 [Planctomycetota bacterium]|jgi:hypothetical protein|nr:hypothetical protein [Planctomycetota bacterium]